MFIGVAAIVIVVPGPDTAVVTKNVLIHGRRAGFGTSLGVSAGLSIWTLAAAVGVASLLRASAAAFTVLKLVGALYLIWLGVQALRAAGRATLVEHATDATAGLGTLGGFRQGILSDLANPKIGIFFTSLLPQFVSPRTSVLLPFLALGAVFVLMTMLWLYAYCLLAARAAQALDATPRQGRDEPLHRRRADRARTSARERASLTACIRASTVPGCSRSTLDFAAWFPGRRRRDEEMAERSFANEVELLRKGAGETLQVEGILAVTKALLQSGVAYVGGYQGAPISHLMDVLGDAREILDELGVYFENSASEATAAAMLAASVHYPLRGAVTFKSTVGLNVASDALANLASGGVTGGALIILGEDYGEGSSIMQERAHAFAMKSQMWLLDPRPDIGAIVRAVQTGFELSESSNTPVMLDLRLRSCHLRGAFVAENNRRPTMTVREAAQHPTRDVGRIVLPPASFAHEQEKVAQRWPAAVRFIKGRGLNEVINDDAADVGIITQGGLYNTVNRSLELLGCSDAFGNTRVPIYVMNVTYPVLDTEIVEFCAGKRAVLLVEEGQPDYIEQNINAILRRAGIDTELHGKDMLPVAGEYTSVAVTRGIARFLQACRSDVIEHEPTLLREATIL